MSTETGKDELTVRKGPDVGDEAPDFEARDDQGQPVKLSDFRGQKNVLLIFYPAAFTGTCTKEFCEMRDRNFDLAQHEDVEVFGVSSDPIPTLRVWRKQEGYVNRFLSDFWPHGAIGKLYGAFDERIGTSLRCTFLIDREGIVRYVERNPIEKLAEARDQQAWRTALEQIG